jgi:hypothetical protein
MRRLLWAFVLTFAVSLAAALGLRLSNEATGVIVGVIAGASAGIPVSLILLAALRRRDSPTESQASMSVRGHEYGSAYPPVLIIQGGGQSPSWPPAPGARTMTSQSYGPGPGLGTRQFTLVGGELWED